MEHISFIRRIDKLGRIVIPKEIRSNLKLKSEDCLEMMIEQDKIIIIKKSLLKEDEVYIRSIIDILTKLFKTNIVLTDNDEIIYVSGKLLKKISGLESTALMHTLISNSKNMSCENKKFINLQGVSYLNHQIIVNGDKLGNIIIIRNDTKLDSSDLFCAKLIETLMIKKLEV